MLLRLRFEREKRGWRQMELALRSGVPQSTISSFEIGNRIPTEAELEALAQILEVRPPSVLLKPVKIMPDPEEVFSRRGGS